MSKNQVISEVTNSKAVLIGNKKEDKSISKSRDEFYNKVG